MSNPEFFSQQTTINFINLKVRNIIMRVNQSNNPT